MVARFRAAGVRTVVWVTPWVNLESRDGQRPPDPESERLHAEPASNYEPAAEAGHFVRAADGTPHVARWWMGTGSPVDFTSRGGRGVVARAGQARARLGVEGIKADDGEGWYYPPDVSFADGRSGAQAAWALGLLYRRSMQRALDEVHPGRGVLFGRPGWTGQQASGVTWGGDQAVRLLVARDARGRHAHGGGQRLLQLVARRGRLPRRAAVARCPKELLLRWVQFGCFTPLMQAHGRFPQEAWTYDDETLRIYRELRPPARAARALRARRGRHRGTHRAADRAAAVPLGPRATSAAGRSPTSTATAPRSGSRPCWSAVRASARCRCRAVTGSTSGAVSACRAAASSSRRRRSGASRSTCAPGRSS